MSPKSSSPSFSPSFSTVIFAVVFNFYFRHHVSHRFPFVWSVGTRSVFHRLFECCFELPSVDLGPENGEKEGMMRVRLVEGDNRWAKVGNETEKNTVELSQ